MSRWSWSVLAATASIAIAGGVGLVAPAAGAPRAASTGYGFRQPTAIATADRKLWIANLAGNSVTVTDRHGALLRVIRATKDEFGHPDAIAAANGKVWVASRAGRITELNAGDGSLVRVVRGKRYDLRDPVALAVHGGEVWVVDRAANAITEINAGDGSLTRVLSRSARPGLGFDAPVALTFAGTTAWVVNQAGSVTGFNASSAALVRRLTAARYGLAAPEGIAYAGHRLWITDSATNSVTETTSSGDLVQVISNSSNNANYGFDAPSVVVAHRAQVYVISPPGSSPMVTKIETSTANGDWYECNNNFPRPHFDYPTGLTVYGSHLWVVSPRNNSLAELHISTGSLVKRIT